MTGLLTRKLQAMNDNGTLGVTIPKDFAEQSDADIGDEVGIEQIDKDEGTITFKL